MAGAAFTQLKGLVANVTLQNALWAMLLRYKVTIKPEIHKLEIYSVSLAWPNRHLYLQIAKDQLIHGYRNNTRK
jgi:hypothetical protein